MLEVTVDEIQQRLAEPDSLLLIDCRESWEVALGTLPEAVHIPLGTLMDSGLGALEVGERQVVVFCHHGVRSLHGALALQERGIAAQSMRGGTDLWSLRIDPTLPRY